MCASSSRLAVEQRVDPADELADELEQRVVDLDALLDDAGDA